MPAKHETLLELVVSRFIILKINLQSMQSQRRLFHSKPVKTTSKIILCHGDSLTAVDCTVNITCTTCNIQYMKTILINGSLSVNSQSNRKPKTMKLRLTFFTICKFHVEIWHFFILKMSFICPEMLHIEKLMGLNNKDTHACLYVHMCTYWHMWICKIRTYNMRMHSPLISELHCSF